MHDEHHQTLIQSRAQVLDLEEQLRISIASESETEVRPTQQATNFACQICCAYNSL
jgi:hypothetical protein